MLRILEKVKSTPDIYSTLADLIKQESNSKKQATTISFVNPFSYMLLRRNQVALDGIDHLHSDAISSSKIFSLILGKTIPRLSFDLGSFARHFFIEAEKHQLPIFLLGAKAAELDEAVMTFREHYPKLNIVGHRDGYFSDDDEVMKQIIASGAQYVICGMGTPRQDEFAGKLKSYDKGQIKQIYTCGGFLHQSAERIDYYPKLINKLHLRWLFRALTTSYVAKRLLLVYPQFLFVVFADRFAKS